jgi:molybdopterin synthase catalytic subunit
MEGNPEGTVHVVCFGWLRERLGAETLVRERAATVLELWSIMTRDRSDFGDPRGRVRAARNLAYCDWETPIEPGDEVAFMPPMAGGSVDDAAVRRVRTALVTDPIDVGRLMDETGGDGNGAIAAFVGAARNRNRDRSVHKLDYEAYLPMAERELLRIAADVTERHGLSALAMVHRIGSLAVGEVSVAVVAAAPHRQAALVGCSEAVEALKRDLPVWKREHHADGAFWVDAREPDTGRIPDGGALIDERETRLGEATTGTERLERDARAVIDASRLSHLNHSGTFRMVDVSERPPTLRAAVAEALVRFTNPATLALLREGSPKVDVLAAARLAGIIGAKHTPELIPLFHPLPLTHLDVNVEMQIPHPASTL